MNQMISNHLGPDPRRLAVLGSTGSIGRQTLDVVRRFPELFQIESLVAGSNDGLLIEQAGIFRPRRVVIADHTKERAVRDALKGTSIQVDVGPEAICDVAASNKADVVVAAMVGYAGLQPVLEAAKSGKNIALANKETLVVAGALVNAAMEESGGTIVPIDSEHSAIFQCLVGENKDSVEELVLTASGGPFRDRPAATFASITLREALAHPNWTMGPKVTIDSATMMNKGLELIEAHWLFGIAPERIKIIVHPQSIVHSMVVFNDGSMKAQLSMPDMRLPIQYALCYPRRFSCDLGRIDWNEVRRLDFELPDPEKFPAIELAAAALRRGGTAPAVLNGANEEAVDLFLKEQIAFTDISAVVESAVHEIEIVDNPQLDDLRRADNAARRHVAELNQTATN